MKNICLLDEMQQMVRTKVCPICEFRPDGSERLGPSVLRACEGKCSIMKNLPMLLDIASSAAADSSGGYEQAILEHICQTCEMSPTAGDFCTRRFTRSCPLSVHGRKVLAALEQLTVSKSTSD